MGAAGFGFCGQLLVDPDRRTVGAVPAAPANGLRDRLRTKSSIGGPSAVVARTELMRQVGGFGEEYYALADWDLWMRLASRATATATPDLLVAYTVHSSNMHLNAPDRVLADFDRFQRAHDLTSAAEIELLEWLAVDLEQPGGTCRGPAPPKPRPPAPPPGERPPSGTVDPPRSPTRRASRAAPRGSRMAASIPCTGCVIGFDPRGSHGG